jgi:hypothetical protein
MPFTCPVCGYDQLRRPPAEFLICSSCGTEFGLDDSDPYSPPAAVYERLREAWIGRGMPWFSQATPQPADWDPYAQLLAADLIEAHADLSATSEIVESEPIAQIVRSFIRLVPRPASKPTVTRTKHSLGFVGA